MHKKGQIQLIFKVLRQIRLVTEMRQVLLNSRWEDGFTESVWIKAKTTYFDQNRVEQCMKGANPVDTQDSLPNSASDWDVPRLAPLTQKTKS